MRGMFLQAKGDFFTIGVACRSKGQWLSCSRLTLMNRGWAANGVVATMLGERNDIVTPTCTDAQHAVYHAGQITLLISHGPGRNLQ